MAPGATRPAAAIGMAGPAVVLLLGLVSGCGPDTDARARAADPDSFHKGIHLGLFHRDDAAWARRSVEEMAALGADAMAIMVGWVTPDIHATAMFARGDITPSDAVLTHAIRAARARGLRVFLMPYLYVDRLEHGQWRGTLDPPDWEAWFSEYTRFILRYARLAQREGVDLFSVGSELCSAESRRTEWIRLIDRVREVYSGRLTYSANWDHREGPSFWDALDTVGINAYFGLDAPPGADVDALVAAWEPVMQEISEWRARLGRRVLVTEVGYPSRAGAAADPWNHGAGGEPLMEEQYRCYRAFQRVWGGQPWLEGVYFYYWWGDGGPGDNHYTPRGKPAEAVIRDWFDPESRSNALGPPSGDGSATR